MESKYIEYNGILYIFDKKYDYNDIFFMLKNEDVNDINKLTRINKNIKEIKCEYRNEIVNRIKKLERNIKK